jgi:hypothetical protein
MPNDSRLSGAGLLHGPPRELGQLRLDSARGGVTKWNLAVPHPYETWIYCSYGALQLATRVAPAATVCTATSKTVAERLDASFLCQ